MLNNCIWYQKYADSLVRAKSIGVDRSADASGTKKTVSESMKVAWGKFKAKFRERFDNFWTKSEVEYFSVEHSFVSRRRFVEIIMNVALGMGSNKIFNEDIAKVKFLLIRAYGTLMFTGGDTICMEFLRKVETLHIIYILSLISGGH
jgi:hypothetical protein